MTRWDAAWRMGYDQAGCCMENGYDQAGCCTRIIRRLCCVCQHLDWHEITSRDRCIAKSHQGQHVRIHM